MAAENTFDIVCKIDMQEVANALDQTRREVETRYDLKAAKNEITLDKQDIVVLSADDMKLKAVVDILQSKLHKRGVPLKALTYGAVEDAAGKKVHPIEYRDIPRATFCTPNVVSFGLTEAHARDQGNDVVVGVNRYQDADAPSTDLLRIDPDVERRQVERVRALRASRDERASRAALEGVEAAARGTANLVTPIIAAVEARATLGEIADAMRRVFGEHRDTSGST